MSICIYVCAVDIRNDGTNLEVGTLSAAAAVVAGAVAFDGGGVYRLASPGCSRRRLGDSFRLVCAA